MIRESFTAVGSGQTIARAGLDATQISGTGGAVYPRLFIQLRFEFHQLHNSPADYVFTGLDAHLSHPTFGVIANALPVRLQRVQRHHWPHGSDEIATLEFPLDHPRIHALEKLRDGKDLPLKLDLSLAVEEHSIIEGDEKLKRLNLWGLRWLLRLNAQVSFTVPRSTWIERVLPHLGYGVVHLIELPAVPLQACEALHHSYEALRQAQSLHRQGYYDESVTKCRIALDPFFDYIPVDPNHKDSRRIPVLKKSWETRVGEATGKWLNSTLGALKDAANPTAHSPHPHFDQFESQMLQAIAANVIAYAARYLGASESPSPATPS